jgi:hypothetical protein
LFLMAGGVAQADHTPAVISAGKLARDAKDFYGRTVTVKGEVEDVIGSNMLTLDEDPDVLVIVPSGLTRTLRHDEDIVITGEVRPYVEAELERDFDFFERGKIADLHKKVDFKTRPVIVARSLRTESGTELMRAETAVTRTEPIGGAVATGPVTPEERITATTLVRHPDRYYGRTVRVKAEVEDVLGPNMFTLDEDAVLAGPDVLVLVPHDLSRALAHDEDVIVTGEVRPFVQAELERDFDFFKNGKIVDVKHKVDWEKRPVIVASSIRSLSGADLLRAGAARDMDSRTTRTTRTTTTTTTIESSAVGAPISTSALVRSPNQYYGQRVTVRADVDDVIGPNMFTLDEDAVFAGPDVLVLVPRGISARLTHDQKIVVTGQVRPFIQAELERDFDFFKNGKLVQVKRNVDWETRPVIVADSIRTDAGVEIGQR